MYHMVGSATLSIEYSACPVPLGLSCSALACHPLRQRLLSATVSLDQAQTWNFI